MMTRQLLASMATLLIMTSSGCGPGSQSEPPHAESSLNKDSPQTTPVPQPQLKQRGADGPSYLDASTENWRFVAVDEQSFDEMVRASVRSDRDAFMSLGRARRVFAVTERARVQILDSDFSKAKIQVLDGEQAGKVGWVPIEFIKS